MALSWHIAVRYLRGRRSANIAPLISRISIAAVAVCSAAMIIVFSVLNGFVSLNREMYKAFYPDLKITVAKGKFFTLDTSLLASIRRMPGVVAATPVIEDNVFADNNGQQMILTLKGIENDYFRVNDVTRYIFEGDTTVSAGKVSTAIAGREILNQLGADVNTLSTLVVNYPNPSVVNPVADPASAILSLPLHPSGTFRIGEEFDGRYLLAPLSSAQELFHATGKCASVEIKTEPSRVAEIQRQLVYLLGDRFIVATRFEQNKLMYSMMGTEKTAVSAILDMVLLIAFFNMIGALSMMVLEKRKDIAILRAMGATIGTIRSIFLVEGLLWSFIGCAIGICSGVAICLAQQKYGLISLGSGSFLVDAYPVQLEPGDVLLVLVTVLTVGFVISLYPALRATATDDPSLKSA